MRKKYTDKSAGFQTKRKRQIRKYAFKSILLAIVIILLTIFCANQNKAPSVCYKENSKVDYKVFLKENEFYNNSFVEMDNQYIASLIDYITADFNYELAIFEENIEYEYKYKIEAEVNVKERSTDKSIYNFKEELITEKNVANNSKTDLTIDEHITIDYNKYNDLIKKFVSVYDLDEAESTLIIRMCININGSNSFARDENAEYVVSLEIPLTTKTIAINLNSNLVGCEEALIVCENKQFCWMRVPIIIAVLVEIILIIKLINYTVKSRTPENVYKLELNRILNNYGTYIQKINDLLDLDKYQLVYLDTFNDMLEIRDTIQEPVLMFEAKEERKTYFMIPSKTNILYIYELKVNNNK